MESKVITEGAVPLSMIHPNFLHSNSTSHTWALGAIAELIDNAYDPDVGAKHLHIDKTKIAGQLCLTFLDDGNGMDFKKLHQLLSFGYCDKTNCGRTKSNKPIGRYGNGFKSGTMRLGNDVIVFTKCETSASVGFLSQTYLQGINADSVSVPLLEYEVPTLTPKPHSSRDLSLKAILKYPLYSSEEDLVAELSTMGVGTKIVIFNLKKINGSYELDFKTDRYDIRCPEAYMTESNKKEERPLIESNNYKRSLKEYYSILYYRTSSTNMKVFIRGSLVNLKLMSKTLKEKEEQFYKPKSEEKQIRVDIGFSPEKNAEDYGMLLYHTNRLIKAYEKVGCQRQANERGVGVILVAKVDFLTPNHTKQDFVTDAKYNSLVQCFAKKVNDFWKKKREKCDTAKGPRTPSKHTSGSSKAAENSHVLPGASSALEVSEPLQKSADITPIKTEVPEVETRGDLDDTIIILDDDDEDSVETVPPEAAETTPAEPDLSVDNRTTMSIENGTMEQVTNTTAANSANTPSTNVSGNSSGLSLASPSNTPTGNLIGISVEERTFSSSQNQRPLSASTEEIDKESADMCKHTQKSTSIKTELPEQLTREALDDEIIILDDDDEESQATVPPEALPTTAVEPDLDVDNQLDISIQNGMSEQVTEPFITNINTTSNNNVSEHSIELTSASSGNEHAPSVNESPNKLRRSSRTQKKRQRSTSSEENDKGEKTSDEESPGAKKILLKKKKPLRKKIAVRMNFAKKSDMSISKISKAKAVTGRAKQKFKKFSPRYRPTTQNTVTSNSQPAILEEPATPPVEKADVDVQTDETTSSKTTPFHYKVFKFLKSLPQLELPANVGADNVENFICEQNEK